MREMVSLLAFCGVEKRRRGRRFSKQNMGIEFVFLEAKETAFGML